MAKRIIIIVIVIAVLIMAGIGVYFLFGESGSAAEISAAELDRPYHIHSLRPRTFHTERDGTNIALTLSDASYATFTDNYNLFRINFRGGTTYTFIITSFSASGDDFSATMRGVLGGRMTDINLHTTAHYIVLTGPITETINTEMPANPNREPHEDPSFTHTITRVSTIATFHRQPPPYLGGQT